jgi:ATP-dependent protease ClpP protease subunit
MIKKVNFKYIKNINSAKKFAEMFIYDEIGDEGVNGKYFAYELAYLMDREDIDEVKVRINSVGGSVMHAFSIFSSIINANKQNKIAVNTYNDGVAASSAGFILLAGKNIYVKDYARLMVHGVAKVDENGKVTGDLSENDKSALQNFGDMISQVMSSRTDISEKVIKDLLNNGKDNWFNASEGSSAGFYPSQNIEKTGLEIDLPEDLSNTDLTVVMNKARKILINNQKPLQMKKVIAALKLQEGSSEEIVLTAVTNALRETETAKTALQKAVNKNTEQEATILTLKTQVENSNKSAALSIVENAIKEGKFVPKDETEKENIVNQCLKDVDGFKNMIALMPTKAANVLNVINKDEKETGSLLQLIENKSFRDLEKGDAVLLARVKNEAKGEYVKLYNKQYNTNKTEADF